jgi:hypothetical protein
MTPAQFTAFLNDLANQAQPIALKTCDRVANTFKQNVTRDCPVDKGTMKGQIIKQPLGSDKIRVYVNTDYAVPVDHGHKTRQGTGRAPNYKPKPGGKSSVPANPFFTKNKDKLIADNTLATEYKADLLAYIRNRMPR